MLLKVENAQLKCNREGFLRLFGVVIISVGTSCVKSGTGLKVYILYNRPRSAKQQTKGVKPCQSTGGMKLVQDTYDDQRMEMGKVLKGEATSFHLSLVERA